MTRPALEEFGTLITDEVLKIHEADRKFCEDFSCSADELQGLEVSEIISAKDRLALRTIDRAIVGTPTGRIDIIAVLEVGEIRRLSRLVLRRDGPRWWVTVECIDSAGNLVFDLFSGYRRWSAALKGSADGVVFVDQDLVITDYNAHFVEFMSFRSEHGVLIGEEALAGAEFHSLLTHDAFSPLRELQGTMWGSGGYRGELRVQDRWFDLEVIPQFLPIHGLVGFSASFRDVSDRYRVELEREARRNEQLQHGEEIIRVQKEFIRALSAPRIPISPTVTVVPLIGRLDRERMDELVEGLLEGAAKDQTETMLFDLTGITEIDEDAATALLRATQALRLIGTRSVLTGIKPRTAQILTETELGAGEVTIYSSLQDAIRVLLLKRS